jgi:hypothetical protein
VTAQNTNPPDHRLAANGPKKRPFPRCEEANWQAVAPPKAGHANEYGHLCVATHHEPFIDPLRTCEAPEKPGFGLSAGV